MTFDSFKYLENQSGLRWLTTEQKFLDAIRLDKAIIYLLVDWSKQERISRHIVYKVLSELDKNSTPVFQIDCSDQKQEYVVKWLSKQQDDSIEFYYGGNGETLFVDEEKIIDFIKYPAQLGLEKVKEKLAGWKHSK